MSRLSTKCYILQYNELNLIFTPTTPFPFTPMRSAQLRNIVCPTGNKPIKGTVAREKLFN